jgi:hypothetical protein
MTTPPQPPVSPGPAEPYTLQNLMPAPSGTAPAPLPAYPGPRAAGPPQGYPPPPPGYRPPVGPRKKPHWWRDLGQGGQAVIIIGAILAPVLIGVLIFATYANRASAGSIKVDITNCEYSGSDTLPTATIEFTAENTSGRAKTVRLRWEYRDSGGALVDTDSTRVTIPAGDTVRGTETTILNAPATGGRCAFAGGS